MGQILSTYETEWTLIDEASACCVQMCELWYCGISCCDRICIRDCDSPRNTELKTVGYYQTGMESSRGNPPLPPILDSLNACCVSILTPSVLELNCNGWTLLHRVLAFFIAQCCVLLPLPIELCSQFVLLQLSKLFTSPSSTTGTDLIVTSPRSEFSVLLQYNVSLTHKA